MYMIFIIENRFIIILNTMIGRLKLNQLNEFIYYFLFLLIFKIFTKYRIIPDFSSTASPRDQIIWTQPKSLEQIRSDWFRKGRGVTGGWSLGRMLEVVVDEAKLFWEIEDKELICPILGNNLIHDNFNIVEIFEKFRALKLD